MLVNNSLEFDLNKSLKTKPEDSFFNVQTLLHISANQITKFLYRTKITPHNVILTLMLFGIASAFLIVQDQIILRVFGAVLLFYKNVLDKVDGSLARATGLDSRRGRFYDSISDFIVNFSVFTSIAYYLFEKDRNIWVLVIVYAAMVISMLQCSYFIFYQVSFIKLSGKNSVNRLIEKITPDDRESEDKFTLFLQRIFLIIYGWQDLAVFYFDKFLLKKLKSFSNNIQIEKYWYLNKSFLTTASFLSIGSHMVLIAVFSIFRFFEAYLFVNLILWNLLLIYSVGYHYKSIKNKVQAK